MTIAVDMGRKATKTNKQTNRNINYKSPTGARGRYKHNGLRMNTAQDVTDITCQFLMFKLILQNLKVY